MYYASVDIRSLFIGTLFFCALTPNVALAVQSTEWSFAGETLGSGWEIGGEPSLTATEDGLRISTTARSLFGRPVSTGKPIDAIQIDYKSDTLIEGGMYWHEKGYDVDNLTSIPLKFAPTTGIGTVHLDMTKYSRWERKTDFVGIGLPPNVEITIHRMKVEGWNPVEKLATAFKSFWHFDAIRPSTINFIWGPHIAFTPLGNTLMFQHIPPVEQSANRYFYFVIAIAVVWALFSVRKHPQRRRHVALVLAGIIAGLWILYDLRMGSEFLSYAKHDYDSYWSKPVGQRTFRERSFFTDFALGTSSLVEGRKEYVFLAPQRWPYLGLIRYYTYPVVPAEPEQERSIDTWVMYKRPDIFVNAQGQLATEEAVLSGPGEILHEFDTGTFIFRLRP